MLLLLLLLLLPVPGRLLLLVNGSSSSSLKTRDSTERTFVRFGRSWNGLNDVIVVNHRVVNICQGPGLELG